LLLWSLNSCGEQAIFKLDIKKKSGLSLNPDIHHSKVFSSGPLAGVEEKTKSIFLEPKLWCIIWGMCSTTVGNTLNCTVLYLIVL